MLSKIKTIILSSVLVIAGFSFANAAEVNYPGFSGNINTTVTTGLSVRVAENCLSKPGGINLDSTFISAVNTNRSADATALIAGADGAGCASQYTDGYGNTPDATSGPRRKLVSSNANDGIMNFGKGDIFNQTTRIFSEIDGTFDGGVGFNGSFVASYNPITSFTNPTWAPFTDSQLDNIETNVDLLDFYVTTDLNPDVTMTAGRFVTNWGESTFIPVGMNGLTTNAIDLAKLRVPGSSIEEALVPATQLTLSGYLDGGWSYEAYAQFDESHVEFDEAGTFFGNEVVSGDRIVYTSAFSGNSQAQSDACSYLIAMPAAVGGAGLGCTQAAVDFFNTAAGKRASTMYLFQEKVKALATSDNALNIVMKAGQLGLGATGAAAIGGAGGDLNSLIAATGGPAGILAGYAAWDEFDRKQGRKAGALDASGGNHIYADGDEQFGISFRTYLDNVGSGVDLGFYYAQYDSKAPYLRFKGQQGIYATDLLGLFTMSGACKTNKCDDTAGAGDNSTGFADGDYMNASGSGLDGTIASFTTQELIGWRDLHLALAATAYGEAACGAYQNPQAVDELYNSGGMGANASNFAYSDAQKSNALTYYNYTNVGGKLYHDSTRCYDNANENSVLNQALGLGSLENFATASTQASAAALLGAAVTPLNLAEYEFIYPENLQAMGVSANTNFGGTTVQAEITYRPNFPLATDGGDQGQQLSDAVGASALLTIGVVQSVRGACALAGGSATYATVVAQDIAKCGLQVAGTAAYRAGTGDLDAEWADIVAAVKNVKRTSLPTISTNTVAAGDYYTTPFIEYDVWSGTLGTTTSFSASHPVTRTLGADSSVFLTELGFVSVPDLNDAANGNVARGGFRDGVGGARCGGITNGGGNPTLYGRSSSGRIADGATHLGSGQTDPLFGNGSYCESKNSIDKTSMTYRLVGSATYNNIANTPWTLSPSFVWSHDFSGYGPTSVGGFVPGRNSLSLGASLSKGDVRASFNYVNQQIMGDEMDNLAFDRDYVSASVSYAF